jgi:GMP synthase (glutamine-hydrolysing)
MGGLDAILVLDFGGQYCHLIARRIREQGVYSEIVPCDTTAGEIKSLRNRMNIKGIILSGGPSSVYEENAPPFNPEILGLDIPILGLCYGHQLIAHLSGGEVRGGERKEYGLTEITVDKSLGVLEGLGPRERVWMSHGDTVFGLPDGFEALAHSGNCPVAAFRCKEKPVYGLQWHPEVVHTEHGTVMLRNFIFKVCGCETNWAPASLTDRAIDEIRRGVGEKRAIIALSGGIDSSTVTILASKAIGKNLTAVFVDHGFMRQGEPEFVEKVFKELGVNIVVVDARERFFGRLRGVVDPEAKRKVIGEEFIKVFEEVAEKTGGEYLLQGTIYPDRIESGIRRHSDKIKSHHNVAGLPTKIKFKAIIEPLKDLYKDEVRMVAKSLGLPDEILRRQPFPGPGLAIRLIGAVTPERIDLLKQADRIVAEEIESNEALREGLWQYFAILTDTKSTGIKGDSRAYGYVVAIRAVESQEAMTASFARVPYDVLERISTRITNELPEVTRVVYDISHKPPATIEWE